MSETNSPESTSDSTRRNSLGSSSKKTTRGRSSWLLWLIVLALGGLILVVELPYEMARWKYAAALEAREAGQNEKAYDYLRQAMEKLPDKVQYRLQLAEWKQQDGQYAEALEIVEQLSEQFPDSLELLLLRSQLYLHVKRFDDAIADAQAINRISDATGKPSRGEALNQLAYYRALGKVDLDQAWNDASMSVKEATAELAEAEAEMAAAKAKKDAPGHALKLAGARRGLASVLDTRGFVDYQRDKFDSAQVDFDRAMELLDLSDQHLLQAAADEAAGQRLSGELKTPDRKLRDQNRAVMLYHRALNLKKLGRDPEAEADLAKARELIGREPDDTLF